MSIFNPCYKDIIEERKRNENSPTTLAKKLEKQILCKRAMVRKSIYELKYDRELARLESNTIEIG